MIHTRWRIFINDIFHHLLLLAAVLVFLFAVALSVLRLSLPLLVQHQALVASSLSEVIGAPVSFERMQVSWRHLQPQINLTDVNIWNDKHQALMHIPEVNVRLSLLASVFHRKFELSLLQVRRWKIQLYQDSEGKWQVAGIEQLAGAPTQNPNIALDDLATTLLQIRHLQIQQSDLQINPKNKFAFALTNVNLDWYAKNNIVSLYGNTFLQGPSTGKVQFAVKAQGNWAQGLKAVEAEIFLSTKNFDLAPWLAKQSLADFSWQHGSVNGELWAKWQQDHWQSADAKLTANNLNIRQLNKAHVWGWSTQQANLKMNWQPKQCIFNLSSKQGIYNFANIFRSAMPYQQMAMTGQWLEDHAGNNQLKISSAKIKTTEVDLNAGLNFTWSASAPLDMALMANANFNTLQNVSHYLPAGIMPPSVVDWLDKSIKSGDGLQAEMLWRGPPKNFPFKDQSGTMQIEGSVNNVNLDYAKGWPAITGLDADLYFTSHGMHIQGHGGKLGNIAIGEVGVDIPQFQKQSRLIIQSKLQTNLADAWQFLSQSKLKDTLSSLLTQMNAQGPVALNLSIDLPLYEDGQGAQYKGDLQLTNDQISLIKLPIQITQLNGPLYFNNHVVQSNLTGQWFDQPWKFVIDKQKTDDQLQLKATGKAPIENWIKQEFPFAASWISGSANVNADFAIGSDEAKTFKMLLTSDLKGVSVKLPIGMEKQAGDANKFSTELHTAKNQDLKLKVNWASPQGDLIIKHDEDVWKFFTPKGDAEIYPATEADPVWKINLQNVNVKSLDGSLDDKFKISDSFPALDIKASNIILKTMTLNGLNLQLRPIENGVAIQNLTIDHSQFKVSASGDWHKIMPSGLQTHLHGKLTTMNLANTLIALGFPNLVNADKSKITFDLFWPGAIWQMDRNQLSGKLQVTTGQGVFTDVSDQANSKLAFGRMLSLLSVSQLPQHLTSRFNDMTQKGFPFDQLTGQMDLLPAKLNNINTQITGPVANVSLQGCVNTEAKKLNLIAEINPKLTGSLPVIATIAGGPVLGAIGFLADKVLSPAVGELSASYYAVQGDEQNPKTTKVDPLQAKAILRDCPV